MRTLGQRTFQRLLRDDRGGAGIWMLFVSIIVMLLGGVAVDTSKAWRMKAMLQAVADSASHAGAIALVSGGNSAAVATARAYAEVNLPPDQFGDVLKELDIEVGGWDPDSRGFDLAADPDAVRVMLRRSEANGNPEPVTLLRLAGLDSLDISVGASARRFEGVARKCRRRGLIARGTVDLQSNNLFQGTCVAGLAGVEVNNNNQWLSDVQVAVPTAAHLTTPSSDWNTHNPGLADALVIKAVDAEIIDDVANIIQDYMLSTMPVNVRHFDFDSLAPGSVNFASCPGNQTLTIPGDAVIEDVVIVTDCKVKFSQGATIIGSIIGTTAGVDNKKSADLSVSSSVTFGADDNCAPGGGSQLLVVGDVKSAAGLTLNGSQIVATGDIAIAAHDYGLNGASIIAGGSINVSSNNAFGGCDTTDFAEPGWDYAVVD